MSDDQARRLWDAAGRTDAEATLVEIGSFRGRSTIVLARSAPPGARIYAIDPHGGGDRGPQEIRADTVRGDADHEGFNANLAAAGVDDRVEHIRAMSNAAQDIVPGPVDLLYIDGAHRFRPALEDIQTWGARVPVGGTMLIHDCWSSVGVTIALLVSTVFGRGFRYVGRSRTLAEFRREELSRRARADNAIAQLGELPWFARNVATKVAITVGATGVARRLGDGSGEWPY